MGDEVKKEGRSTKYLVAGIAIGIVIVALMFLLLWLPGQIQRSIAQPDIVVIEIEGHRSGLDYANVTATLYNRGDADGYATVKLYTTWGDYIFDHDVRTVFVPVRTSIKVTAYLDLNSSESWYAFATIMDQWKS